MIRRLTAVIAGLALAPAQACELADATRIDLADGMAIYYRLVSPPLEVGRHFAMQFRVCAANESIDPGRFASPS